MFKYEMHMHSSPCSGGGAPIERHIEMLKNKGFSGGVITNHFFRGDTKIDRTLPWADFVDAYNEDYERGKKKARLYDLDLHFGIEEHIGGGKEILVYGITPDFLYRHPELASAGVSDYALAVHKAGGLVFQAHPFRDRWYISDPGPIDDIRLIDGIEVFNFGNINDENEKAKEFAEENGLRTIAGSDAHGPLDAGRTGILSPVRIRTEKELVSVLISGNYKLI